MAGGGIGRSSRCDFQGSGFHTAAATVGGLQDAASGDLRDRQQAVFDGRLPGIWALDRWQQRVASKDLGF